MRTCFLASLLLASCCSEGSHQTLHPEVAVGSDLVEVLIGVNYYGTMAKGECSHQQIGVGDRNAGAPQGKSEAGRRDPIELLHAQIAEALQLVS